MKRPRRSNPIVYALYANAIVLVLILAAMLSRGDMPQFLPAAMAQAQMGSAGGSGLCVMPAQLSTNTWGCYVMDTDTQVLCAYQFTPGDKLLRLVAARNFKYDRKLANFNTSPSPQEVSELLEKESKGSRGMMPKATNPSP